MSGIAYVYLMHSPSQGICKIGQSANLQKRLQDLRIDIPLPDLEIVHQIQCDSGYADRHDTEYMLHHAFQERRLETEWFWLTPEDIEQIKRWKTEKDVLLDLFPAWHAWLKTRRLKQFSPRNYRICKRYAYLTKTYTSDWVPDLPHHRPTARRYNRLDNWGIASPPVKPRKIHKKRALLRDLNIEEIRSLYDSGMTQTALAKRYGVAQGSIGRLVARKERGVKANNTPLSDGDAREIRRLHASGITQAEIAKRYGVVPQTIGRVVRGITFQHIEGAQPSSRAKLNADQVREVLRLHASGMRQADLARLYEVSPFAISSIVRGKSWKHVNDTQPSSEDSTQ